MNIKFHSQVIIQLIFCLSCTATFCQINGDSIKYRESPLPVYESGARTMHCKYHSDTFNTEIGYTIYLPKSYFTATDSVFPVYYFLHGAMGNYVQGEDTNHRIWNEAIEKGDLPEMVIVFPNGIVDVSYRGKVGFSIINELMPHINTTYRVSDCRECTVINGFSMGGHGSMRFALLNSSVFGHAMSMAGAPYTEVVYELIDSFKTAQNPAINIWISVGTEDRTLNSNRWLHNSLDTAGIPHEYHEFPGIGHHSSESYNDSAYYTLMMRWLRTQLQNSCPKILRNAEIPTTPEELFPYVDEYNPYKPVPIIPLGIHYDRLSDSAFLFRWEENWHPVNYYLVERLDPSTGQFNLLDTVDGNVTEYLSVFDAECRIMYSHRFKALNDNGESAYGRYNFYFTDCVNDLIPLQKDESLTLYPNPVYNNTLKLIDNFNSNTRAMYLAIFDSKGKRVLSFPNYQVNEEISIASLSKGLYYLEITSSKGVRQTKKFLKF